jgi:hypothetical protein
VPKSFPHRASVVSLPVDIGKADEVRVEVYVVEALEICTVEPAAEEDRNVDAVLDFAEYDDTAEEQDPNLLLHPFPQYALVVPQYPY